MKKTWFMTGASRGLGRIWAEAALMRGDQVTATARKLAGVAKATEGSSKQTPVARRWVPQHQNLPLQRASAIPGLPWSSRPRLRYSPGLAPTTRLNALLNAASDS